MKIYDYQTLPLPNHQRRPPQAHNSTRIDPPGSSTSYRPTSIRIDQPALVSTHQHPVSSYLHPYQPTSDPPASVSTHQHRVSTHQHSPFMFYHSRHVYEQSYTRFLFSFSFLVSETHVWLLVHVFLSFFTFIPSATRVWEIVHSFLIFIFSYIYCT